MSDVFNHELDAFESLMDDSYHGEVHSTHHLQRRRGRIKPAIFNGGWDEALSNQNICQHQIAYANCVCHFNLGGRGEH